MDDEILQEFLAESWENLSQLNTEIVLLEKEPGNRELLASIFRTIHTIKGSCGFIGLDRLGKIAHSGENVLGKMREGVLDVSTSAISLILRAIDVIKELLVGIEATGAETEIDSSELIAELDHFAETGTVSDSPSSPSQQSESVPTNEQPAESSQSSTSPSPSIAEAVAGNGGNSDSGSPCSNPAEETVETDVMSANALTSSSGGLAQADAETTAALSTSADATTNGKKSISELSIRVNVDVLDSLMNFDG
ncbi:MAG: Hpt domain-containing protein, partial [Planctomycetes bacterium]|nr:Hpt domain-containing protein [Planctomycetota bacterium]